MAQKINQQFLNINELSDYINIKEKTLYALAASGDIPRYRIGRLIRFKKEEIDAWIETKKVARSNPNQTADKIFKSIRKPPLNIDRVVKKTIDEVKGASYTVNHGKSDRIEGLRKEVNNGSL